MFLAGPTISTCVCETPLSFGQFVVNVQTLRTHLRPTPTRLESENSKIFKRKSEWECLPTLLGYDAEIIGYHVVCQWCSVTSAVIWRLFTAILRINAATAPNWTALTRCTAHTQETLLSSIHVYWENVHDTAKVTQPVSGKRNIWTNSMYKDFLPAIAFFTSTMLNKLLLVRDWHEVKQFSICYITHHHPLDNAYRERGQNWTNHE